MRPAISKQDRGDKGQSPHYRLRNYRSSGEGAAATEPGRLLAFIRRRLPARGFVQTVTKNKETARHPAPRGPVSFPPIAALSGPVSFPSIAALRVLCAPHFTDRSSPRLRAEAASGHTPATCSVGVKAPRSVDPPQPVLPPSSQHASHHHQSWPPARTLAPSSSMIALSLSFPNNNLQVTVLRVT